MRVLVPNSGESSLRGLVDSIGRAATRTLKADGMREAPREQQVLDHHQVVPWVFERLGRAY